MFIAYQFDFDGTSYILGPQAATEMLQECHDDPER
jgi:hypothetical protein